MGGVNRHFIAKLLENTQLSLKKKLKYIFYGVKLRYFSIYLVFGLVALSPGHWPLPIFQCHTHVTLKNWEWPGDEAISLVHT